MEANEMQKMIYRFEELSSDLQHFAGGKGGSLAKLYQSGFPVPEGFVIAAPAFVDDQLLPEAWRQVQDQLDLLRGGDGEQAFAIRSSALSEDSESLRDPLFGTK
jgi:rifampicin phosphotransferase